MTEILNAREAVERILEEAGLRAFVYTVEPKAEGWRLSIDCAAEGGWQSITLPVDGAELGASLHDRALREKLRRQWEPRLRACATR
jgi:hypothetical protein